RPPGRGPHPGPLPRHLNPGSTRPGAGKTMFAACAVCGPPALDSTAPCVTSLPRLVCLVTARMTPRATSVAEVPAPAARARVTGPRPGASPPGPAPRGWRAGPNRGTASAAPVRPAAAAPVPTGAAAARARTGAGSGARAPTAAAVPGPVPGHTA